MGEQVSVVPPGIFNVFNHANLGDPDSLLESAASGSAVGRRSVGSWSLNALQEARHVQIGLKIYF